MVNFKNVFIFLIFINFCNAQVNSNSAYFFNYQNQQRDRLNSYNANLEQAINASDALNWQQASAVLNGELKQVLARYNSLNDHIEVKDGAKVFKLSKRNNLKITFLDADLVYEAKSYYGDDGKKYTSYFIIDDFSNELGIVKRKSFEQKIEDSAKHRSLHDREFELAIKDTYYIIDKDNKLFYLTTNRQLIKKSFPEKSSAIIKYVRSNRLNENNEKDMIALARFIKTLV